LGVKENKYTELSPDTLHASAASLGSALAAKLKRYEDELARLTHEDNLCKEFAGVADPIAKTIDTVKARVAESKSDLDTQAQYVRDSLADADKESRFPKLHELQGQIDTAGIAYNPHTMLTAADLDVQWTQFKALLNSKKVMFEEEIEHNKMRGLTKEQYVEIEEQFKQFDKSKNGLLEKNEFKACLYSLGHEKTGQEVVAVMAKYGAKDGKGMQYDGFKEFMINELGDNDSKDDINAGFKLLNKDTDVCKMANLEILMEDADVGYLKEHMKATGDAYDFKTWTESVFAR
jgi:actinin alpha